ncbi:hypothetical protein A5724_05815 [Mycobacterium sp. ACS1612]|uniref:alpha/beta fold hydrolase n=1 Tax=Mycobacterium sp. ACS1612 TaxID=1834117 RepID=UPI0007FBF2C6|nr:alpha/beta fold hydrolase [Mycobacterium sp. ACS1612]OBF41087.1 hypothetical protein A5724_05815 [Mycobacterium sp. ACS1612]
MATFGLVHGAWHGAWCWERLIPELEALGHRAIAMDLPCDDSSATFDDYADVVCAAVTGVAGDLVLVGHSLAGQTIPLVAARRPVRRLVYLCAIPASPGQSLLQQLSDPDMLNPDYVKGLGAPDSQARTTWVDEDVLYHLVFGDCNRKTVSWASMRLRPQATIHYELPCSLSAYPIVDTTYVLCDGDRMVNPSWSRRVARDWLNAELVELPGDHSPFLSRPAELAAVLDRLA